MKRATFRVLPHHYDILDVRADIHVCPVNCQPGVMGKGLALKFAQEFVGLKARHFDLCCGGDLRPGNPWFLRGLTRGRINDFDKPIERDEKPARCNVLLFPTKDDWGKPAEVRWIWQGLGQFLNILRAYDITVGNSINGSTCQIVFPALGCGLGGLHFGDIVPIMKAWSACLDERFEISLIEPRSK